MPATVSSNGIFSLTGVFPGVYRIAIRGGDKLPPGAYIKSARLGTVDALSPRLMLESEPRADLEIVIGLDPGVVEATASAEGQASLRAITVVLVPDVTRRGRYEQYFTGATDASGQVRLDGVVPGDYQVFAWEAIDSGAWWDPEFLSKYEGRGTSLHVEVGGEHRVPLKLIPVQ
jgi:hypothetical protein